MQWRIEEWRQEDLADLCRIWNRVVEDGVAFPQTDPLTEETGREFFAAQSFTGVAHCLTTARQLGFRIMQSNAVVATNAPALALYKKLGFIQLGIIPGGFHAKDGRWLDIIPHYKNLVEDGDEG